MRLVNYVFEGGGGGREFPWVTNFLGLEILNLALGKLFREGKFVRGGGKGGSKFPGTNTSI